jgi:hypothetical protein
MRAGFIDRSLPFIKKVGVETIARPYDTKVQAEQAIPVLVDDYYRKNYPDVAAGRQESIRDAGRALVAAYAANVFPGMKITWGSYPSNIGHIDSPGCFRCHDGEHKSADGKLISNECETCHTLLAVEEENPEILKTLFPQ